MHRLWAAIAAIVMCLALGVPALAQSPSATSEWASVIGTSQCYAVTDAGTEQIGPPYSLTGLRMSCIKRASDPRVTGLATYVHNVETWADPGSGSDMVAWADEEIRGPDGRWTGRAYGICDSEGMLHLVHILAGSEAYEGWTYAYASTVPADSDVGQTTGLIHHSPPPPGWPVEPLLAPASE